MNRREPAYVLSAGALRVTAAPDGEVVAEMFLEPGEALLPVNMRSPQREPDEDAAET